jgi:uncharacterized protein
LLDIVVLFFVLGVLARLLKSDLKLPAALYETLSIYLLLAIGLKGGVELSKQSIGPLLTELVCFILLGFIIPFLLYPLLRLLRFDKLDCASIGAHFGSVSVVTFAVAVTYLTRNGIAFEGHSVVWLVVMEAPGIIAGTLIARTLGKSEVDDATGSSWAAVLHDVVLGKSVFLLMGGVAIGWFGGVESIKPIAFLFTDLFKGALALFLLELGLVAGARIGELGRFGPVIVAVGVIVPPVLALVGSLVALALGLSVGGIAILATLCASASYIAAPGAMRMAIPQANPTLSISIALGVTFPFNILLGVPMYVQWAQYLHR